MRLHHELHPGTGPYLLLVHGFLSSRGQWRPNLAALGQVVRPVVVELLGHGRSPAPEDLDDYRVEAYIEAFEAIRQQLGTERWFICGQSFGAGLTIRYALSHPERVIGQIFTNSNSTLAHPDMSEQDARARSVEEGGRAGLEAMRIHPKHAKRLPPEVKQELVTDAALIDPAAIARAIRVTRVKCSVLDDLGQIRVPTLFVNGTLERKFQPLRDRAAGLLPPHAQVVDLPGGHSVNIDAAEGFNHAVAAFVRALQHLDLRAPPALGVPLGTPLRGPKGTS
jgi:2-succinyl-6-hydroxy-2,4-cyclohexadiene-1-carboxylate synthase